MNNTKNEMEKKKNTTDNSNSRLDQAESVK